MPWTTSSTVQFQLRYLNYQFLSGSYEPIHIQYYAASSDHHTIWYIFNDLKQHDCSSRNSNTTTTEEKEEGEKERGQEAKQGKGKEEGEEDIRQKENTSKRSHQFRLMDRAERLRVASFLLQSLNGLWMTGSHVQHSLQPGSDGDHQPVNPHQHLAQSVCLHLNPLLSQSTVHALHQQLQREGVQQMKIRNATEWHHHQFSPCYFIVCQLCRSYFMVCQLCPSYFPVCQ